MSLMLGKQGIYLPLTIMDYPFTQLRDCVVFAFIPQAAKRINLIQVLSPNFQSDHPLGINPSLALSTATKL